MIATVFYADILGFSRLASAPGAAGAIDALSDVAQILSNEHEIARYLQLPVWTKRYGLSDSLCLLADDPAAAAAAAAQIFFNLAFYNSQVETTVLMRGAIVQGDVREVGPIFPETAKGNVVGQAVVDAVLLERAKPKGPRLFVSEAVAAALQPAPIAWLLDRLPSSPLELLWVLPPDPSGVGGDAASIGDVCRAAVDGFLRHAGDAEALPHHIGYLDLVTRAVDRLRERDAGAAAGVLSQTRLDRAEAVLVIEALTKHSRIAEGGLQVLERIRSLIG